MSIATPLAKAITEGIASGIVRSAGAAAPPAGPTPVFHALTPDTSNDYLMEGVLVGTGGLTATHTATLYAPDKDDVYQQYPANEPVWTGGRCVLDGAAGTDVDTVHGNESPAGAALSEAPYLSYTPAATNSQIRSNDLADAEWTATTMTVGDQDETGITGEPSTACTLTATAGNATVLGSAITDTSDDQATCWYVKRKTGTGTVELTVDGGSTWQAITLTADFQKFTVDQAAVTDPQIGIRIVTSADAVIVGNAECHLGSTEAEVRGLGPIFTTTAAVSTDAPLYVLDIANWDDTGSAWYMDIYQSADWSSSWLNQQPFLSPYGINSPYGPVYLLTNNRNLNSRDAAGNVSIADTFSTEGLKRIGVSYHQTDALKGVNVGGVWGVDSSAYTGFTEYTKIEMDLFTRTGNQILSFSMRDLRRYDITSYAQGKTTIDSLMP